MYNNPDFITVINKQYVSLIHKVIVVAINNFSYDEVNSSKKLCKIEDIQEVVLSLQDNTTSCFFAGNELHEIFYNADISKIVSNLTKRSQDILSDFYLNNYNLKQLAIKYSSTEKAISNEKNRLLKKIKNEFLKNKE